MTLGWLALAIGVAFPAATPGVVAHATRTDGPGGRVSASHAESLSAAQAKGRYKKQGSACVWDANDSGPSQVHAQDGTLKREGDKCVWNAGDSGPNQCDPRQPK